MSLYKNVLIANRGEIACRIIRTCKKMAIPTTAIYAESDNSALHVRMANYALNLGEPTEAYLKKDKIIEHCLERNIEGVHPGYGFLSESSEFAEDCESNGIVYVGPTSECIRNLGLKHTSRDYASSVGLPVVPGSGLIKDLETAKKEAKRIGYPLMLKATGGGGGIGLYKCNSEFDLEEKFSVAKAQGESWFGNSEVFLEKFIEEAKHIEVQIFGDGKGNVVHLWERECSIQRRNQKVIEEAPGNISKELRKKLVAGAIELGKVVKYRSAGTVEFLVDSKTEDFYFLEVNTRLQVEHGITELITGVDLVEWMLKASKYKLDLTSYKTPDPLGHAIELRVCAENPATEFTPCSGAVTHTSFPNEPWLRVDSFLDENGQAVIPPYYDSLIVKLMTFAETRDKAIERLGTVLKESKIEGLQTNLPLFSAIHNSRNFQLGNTTTSFLSEPILPLATILEPGFMTTIQDLGRPDYWHVGIPPSGAFDNLSFKIANILVGNTTELAGLEIISQGPTISFSHPTVIAVTGGDISIELNGKALDSMMNTAINIAGGDILTLGKVKKGQTSYIAIRGGIDAPPIMGSSSTFPFGKFGGLAGRTLRKSDNIIYGTRQFDLKDVVDNKSRAHVLSELYSEFGNKKWEVDVIPGPHYAPEYFTEEAAEIFFTSPWKAHYNS